MREIRKSLAEPTSVDAFSAELLRRACDIAGEINLRHFIPLGYFHALLENRALRFKRIDLYQDDSDEGRLPVANQHSISTIDTIVGLNGDALRNQQAAIHTFRFLSYVHCWFSAPEGAGDSAMWKQYGQNHQGVCIHTTAGRLLTACQPTPAYGLNLYRVTYDDGLLNPVPVAISFAAICRKRTAYKHEAEVRLVASRRLESFGPNEYISNITPAGEIAATVEFANIPLSSLSEWITGITAGAAMPDADFQSLTDLAAKYALPTPTRTERACSV